MFIISVHNFSVNRKCKTFQTFVSYLHICRHYIQMTQHIMINVYMDYGQWLKKNHKSFYSFYTIGTYTYWVQGTIFVLRAVKVLQNSKVLTLNTYMWINSQVIYNKGIYLLYNLSINMIQ